MLKINFIFETLPLLFNRKASVHNKIMKNEAFNVNIELKAFYLNKFKKKCLVLF